jgi:CotH kinase protein
VKRFLGGGLTALFLVLSFSNPAAATADPAVDKTYVEGSDPQAFLFNPLQVNRVDITMTPTDEAALRQEPRVYQPATIKLTTELGATTVYNVGLHIKGGWGSYRSLDEKTGFKVKVDFSVKGQSIYGIKKFTLNNMVQDTSMLHEATAYRLFRAMGVPAPRIGYANVYFNGVNYGLHSNIETYDKKMLSRWIPSGTDHLLEGAYGVEVGPDMQVDEGSLTDLRDITEIRDLNNLSGQEWFDKIRTKVDLNEMIMNWAVEHYIGHWDGYTRGWPNNYYMHKAKNGLWTMHPWGTDQTWVQWNPLIDDGATMMTRCVNYSPCNELYETALAQIQAKLPSLSLPTMVDRIWAKIQASAIADTRKPYSDSDSLSAMQATKNFMANRFQELVNHTGNRRSSSITVTYPQTSFAIQGSIKPKLVTTGDGVLSFKRLEGFEICEVNPLTGAVLVLNSGLCRIGVQLTQTDNYHSAMVTVKLTIPKLASRILVAPIAALRFGKSVRLSPQVDSSGAIALKLKSGRCKVSGQTVKALTRSGKCLVTVSVAGDENYLAASKVVSIRLRF